jgi:hypothetical protein
MTYEWFFNKKKKKKMPVMQHSTWIPWNIGGNMKNLSNIYTKWYE